MALQQHVRYAKLHAYMTEHSHAHRRQLCIFWLEALALHFWDQGLGHNLPASEGKV